MTYLTTKNNVMVFIPESTKAHMEAHPDISMDHLAEAVGKIKYYGGFLKKQVDMGRVVGKTSCVKTSDDDEVLYFYRKNRIGKTPFVKNREKEDTTNITVILTKDSVSGNPILITAFYGDLAPMEPWDARRKKCKDDVIRESDIFWSTHALVYEEETIDFSKED